MTENQKTAKSENQELKVNLRTIARGMAISMQQVQAVMSLLDDGNTVPFITRYRKDETGNLNEVQIRQILDELTKQRQLIERKQTILHSLESQGKLTPELASSIRTVKTAKQLEDLYFPFKAKKQTLATQARRRGLEPLALEILAGDDACADLNARAADFVNPEKNLPDVESVLTGVGHILAEIYSDDADLRRKLREIIQRTAQICTTNVSTEMTADVKPADAKAADTKPAEAKTTPDSASVAVADEAAEAAPAVESASESEPAIPAESEEISKETPEVSAENSTDAVTNVEAEAATDMDADANATAVTEAPKPETTEEKDGSETVPAVETKQNAPGSSKEPKQAPKTSMRAQQRAQKKKREEERRQKEFQDYFAFEEAVSKIPPYRVLAINRGENCGVLRVKVRVDEDALRECAEAKLLTETSAHADFQRAAIRDALSRLIQPALERELRRDLTEKAEAHAVTVFSRNLRNLLLQAPIHGYKVLAIDPGFKNGCKLAALDQFGNFVDHGVVYLTGNKPERREKATKTICDLVRKYSLDLIAIGNGTACRETENFIANLLKNELADTDVAYVIVNEAGASVYSINSIGREDFPDFDATLRGTISIGRRILDPLSELVKIDPANIGVGLYQHDVKAKYLRESLENVVESCVNFVGVDVNTASPALLRFVSGLNQLSARKIYEYRRANGPFRNREQLKNVPDIDEATFVQAAGFLKIAKGENPLDATWIHPESYELATKVLEKLGIAVEDLRKAPKDELKAKIEALDIAALAKELNAGELKLKDILGQLVRPGCDPREDLPAPIFKKGVLNIEDLTVGMEITGTVQNVVDFGAFVDIGLHDSGLLHVSQFAGRYVRDPHDALAVGDVIKTWVLGVDEKRRRVSLTMIDPNSPKTDEASPKKRRHRGGRRNRAKALPSIPQPVGTPSPEVAAIISPETVELHLVSEAPEGFVSSLDRPKRERHRGGRRAGDATGADSRAERSERPRRNARSSEDSARTGDGDASRDSRNQEGGSDHSEQRARRESRPRRSEMPKYQYRKDVPKQPVVLTEDVKKGKAPMHGFAELAAFLKQEKDEPKE